MGRCTWDPTGQEDRCKCHYCVDRRISQKIGPLTSWREVLLLVVVFKKFMTSPVDGPAITSSTFTSFRYAFMLTFVCCAFGSSQFYFHKNILCTGGSINRDELFIAQRYCLMSGTFTLGNFTLNGKSLIHPGIGLDSPLSDSFEAHEVVRHMYYQWVPYFLFFQFLVFSLTRNTIVKSNKDGVFKALVGNLNKIELPQVKPKKDKEEQTQTEGDDATPLVKDVLLQKKQTNGHRRPILSLYQKECKKQAKVFKASMGNHKNFLRMFIFLEIFGSAVALGNLVLTNIFLGNDFLRYGPEMIRHMWHRDIDPLDASSITNQIFPKMAKCTWRNFGASGSIETKDLLCVLPLNLVYEKIYLVLWVAYIALGVVTTLCLIYHFCLFLVPGMLDRKILSYSSGYELRESNYRRLARQVLKHCGLADKFVLLNLKKHTRDFSRYIMWLEVELAEDNKSKLEIEANAPPITETEF